MQKFLLALFSVFILFVTVSAGPAQVKSGKAEARSVSIDTASKVDVRKFDADRLIEYQSDRDFDYNKTSPETKGFFSRLWDWFWSLLNDVLENETAGSFIGYAIIGILVLLILYAVLRFLGMDLKILSSKSKPVEIPYTESADNIHEINFNEEIDKAVNAGNYRLAVRLAYLKTLKYLSDTQQISWQPDKTNQVYANEITDLPTRQVFQKLTRQFEYVWYGDFLIGKEVFSEIKSDFDQFNRSR